MGVNENINLDFEKLVISKFQLKILKLFKLKERINIYQFDGYFNFPGFTDLMSDLQDLERIGLIAKSIFSTGPDDYILTIDGEKYLLFLKNNRNKTFITYITVLAALVTILGFLIELLRH